MSLPQVLSPMRDWNVIIIITVNDSVFETLQKMCAGSFYLCQTGFVVAKKFWPCSTFYETLLNTKYLLRSQPSFATLLFWRSFAFVFHSLFCCTLCELIKAKRIWAMHIQWYIFFKFEINVHIIWEKINWSKITHSLLKIIISKIHPNKK